GLMSGAIEWNLNHGQRHARLFEIGRHYRLNGNESVETRVLTIGATGEAREKGLYDAARDFSFADLKGDLDSIGELCDGFRWEDGGADWLHAARRVSVHLNGGISNSTVHPNAVISSAARNLSSLGVVGQLARPFAEKLKLRQDVF